MSAEDFAKTARKTSRERKRAPVRRARGRPRAKDGGGAAGTRDSILQAAVKVFAERGLGGGRINLISRAARSNDRMIYYYFGSKEKLFVEVLGKIYRDMWEAESALNLDQDNPVSALTQIVQFTMNHYLTYPGARPPRCTPPLRSSRSTTSMYRTDTRCPHSSAWT